MIIAIIIIKKVLPLKVFLSRLLKDTNYIIECAVRGPSVFYLHLLDCEVEASLGICEAGGQAS
jgi:hypothetical protein